MNVEVGEQRLVTRFRRLVNCELWVKSDSTCNSRKSVVVCIDKCVNENIYSVNELPTDIHEGRISKNCFCCQQC